MISVLSFSKDRPLQCEGYLRSLQKAFGSNASRVRVLFKASGPSFASGYGHVGAEYPGVEFVPEHDFGEQVLEWIHGLTTPLATFGCDDVVFRGQVDVLALAASFADADLAGFSLRLGRNIRFSHRRKEELSQPDFTQIDGCLTWKWTEAEGEWAYPFELNGTVYRASYLAALLNGLEQIRVAGRGSRGEWRHPNLLELSGVTLMKAMKQFRRMASFEESRLVVPTVNQVQHYFENPRHGEIKTVEELETLRLQGYHMDVDEYWRHSFDRIHVGEFYLTQALAPAHPGTRLNGPSNGTKHA